MSLILNLHACKMIYNLPNKSIKLVRTTTLEISKKTELLLLLNFKEVFVLHAYKTKCQILDKYYFEALNI